MQLNISYSLFDKAKHNENNFFFFVDWKRNWIYLKVISDLNLVVVLKIFLQFVSEEFSMLDQKIFYLNKIYKENCLISHD
jgi:hypothetical protein